MLLKVGYETLITFIIRFFLIVGGFYINRATKQEFGILVLTSQVKKQNLLC